MAHTTALLNGHIYLNRGQFAQALLIRDDRIALVGTTEAIQAATPADAEVVDLAGRTVIPGFNDSHIHFVAKGEALDDIDLAGTRSIAEVAQRVKDYIAQRKPAPGTVLQGRGWNQDYFVEDNHRLLSRHDLDAITTEYPLILIRACMHILTANSRALELAGLTRDSQPVDGGAFDRDVNGELTGVIRENACQQIVCIRSEPTDEDILRQMRTAMRYALKHGVTSVQTMDMLPNNWEQIWRLYDQLTQEDPLVRIYHQVNFMEPNVFRRFLAEGFHTGTGTPFNRVGPLKMYLDGTLGARTALMRHPYHDDPSVTGIATMTREQAAEMVQIAVENNCQVVMHAIGDGAIELALDTYEPYTQNGNNPLRLGVLHVQITDKPLLERFARQRLLAYVQPHFLDYDTLIVEDRVGPELAATSYAFGTLLHSGVPITFGSDSPVEEINPFNNLYCAVTRKRLNGQPENGFHPEEALDIYEAVDAYTLGSAWAQFEDNVKGRLLPGYYADLAILNQDIFSVSPETMLSTVVDATMCAGRFVYRREGA